MEKLLENLKEAIKHYEDCVDVDADDRIIAESIIQLGRCCREVNNGCRIMYKTIFD